MVERERGDRKYGQLLMMSNGQRKKPSWAKGRFVYVSGESGKPEGGMSQARSLPWVLGGGAGRFEAASAR
jgi:hypothetical protein